MTQQVTIVFLNDQHTSAWMGYEDNGILRFDFTNKRGPRRFFVMPDLCVMFADETHLPVVDIPQWYVHLIDAVQYDQRTWVVTDREIDVIVATDLRTYRVVDLDDFATAMSNGKVSAADAQRLLAVLQRFLDKYFHHGEFPPPEVRRWLGNNFDPRLIVLDSLPDELAALASRTISAAQHELELNIGLKRGTVQLAPHNPGWAELFEKERTLIQNVFGDTIIAIEHVGSTSIPGIPAKPIIDINIGVTSLEVAREMRDRFEMIGYEYRPFKPGVNIEGLVDQELYVRGPESLRTHYVHVAEYGSDFWNRSLLFRDYLRKHPDWAQKYGDLKVSLADIYPNARKEYSNGKEELILQILEMARQDSQSI